MVVVSGIEGDSGEVGVGVFDGRDGGEGEDVVKVEGIVYDVGDIV